MSQNRREMAKEMLINAFIKAVTTDIHSVPGRLETIKQLDFIDALRDKLIDEYIDLEQGGAGSEVLGNIVAVLVKIHPDRQEGEPELNLAMVLEKIKERKAQRELEEQSIGTGLAEEIQPPAGEEQAQAQAQAKQNIDTSGLQWYDGPSVKEIRDASATTKQKPNLLSCCFSFLRKKQTDPSAVVVSESNEFQMNMADVTNGKYSDNTTQNTQAPKPQGTKRS